jgi:hypothetical protein
MLAISDTLKNTLNNGSCTDAEPASGTTCKDSGLARLVLPKDQLAGRWGSDVAQVIVYPLDQDIHPDL